MIFTPTRKAGLDRLQAFLPQAGRHYANSRNYDDGVPEDGPRRNVSQLSPWLHAGLISETQVINSVLSAHSPDASEKFIAEVSWRIYFKGYLEQRPTIWSAYCEQRDAAFARLRSNSNLADSYDTAINGKTGIAAFDLWARELVETAYLHNHARMWFASIWIFTLKLDWTLGADFFLRHLIDADAASNTLSWRWIGGLHTKGKTYLARADNIAKYTANRSNGPLRAEGLAEEADALVETVEHNRATPNLPAPLQLADLRHAYALIVHDEAASHAPLDLPHPPALVIAAARPEARSPRPIGSHARSFASEAVRKGASIAAHAFDCEERAWTSEDDLAAILSAAGLKRIVLPYLPTGWTRDALKPELEPLFLNGHAIEVLNELSRATWPLARAGFFGFKKKASRILSELGIMGI
ncbi:FAD-binding domain-containing protein [Erythrobacter sp. F6033]|uniref:FAD-binding domain-containing protein n=1 Tax=Erythrobacter sp. F6033 TaxID=2926401 RepID=UPI001FF5EA44|nr:FAD-binding domain-containing protein [Erythrobacter sp. F6033]MCK0127450.1 DNA photolyase [Erythrobacter sp. F6033]